MEDPEEDEITEERTVHVVALIEMDVPLESMDILHALNVDGKKGFESSLEERLVGHLMKMKSGPYENMFYGEIMSISVDKGGVQ